MADDLEGWFRSFRHRIPVDRKCLLQRLAGNKIAKGFARIRYPHNSLKMALFADAVARRCFHSRRINDVGASRMSEVCVDRAVASATAYREIREWLRCVVVLC